MKGTRTLERTKTYERSRNMQERKTVPKISRDSERTAVPTSKRPGARDLPWRESDLDSSLPRSIARKRSRNISEKKAVRKVCRKSGGPAASLCSKADVLARAFGLENPTPPRLLANEAEISQKIKELEKYLGTARVARYPSPRHRGAECSRWTSPASKLLMLSRMGCERSRNRYQSKGFQNMIRDRPQQQGMIPESHTLNLRGVAAA
jgi:hypothetical protein